MWCSAKRARPPELRRAAEHFGTSPLAQLKHNASAIAFARSRKKSQGDAGCRAKRDAPLDRRVEGLLGPLSTSNLLRSERTTKVARVWMSATPFVPLRFLKRRGANTLIGQVNAEWRGGRQVSGAGGLIDFLRGAWSSQGGVPIIALPAITGGDGASRIVPRLAMPPSIGRTDPVVVVTEHGVADLRNLSIETRARALIAIAAPVHRAALDADWSALRRAM